MFLIATQNCRAWILQDSYQEGNASSSMQHCPGVRVLYKGAI